ncbi:2-isopropylmalate synthase [Caenispirillum salinarum AK4]|uniref:2-isopropylmalate synthase n=1 Tax=Caenispirillum salinarum AK4 TaxID=1238182 RepID=K9GQX7_9PROT|nr:2-isopropylmalate synthase [Caenispirillum salinarum]EKV27552.1 2-isopropylmalate synthase [Caenispirillum salinarum AK4]
MKVDPAVKYRPFEPVKLTDRTWPDATISRPPIWCAVDLRDGNQALIEPMGTDRKLKMFNLLVEMGFKEIEVGFPAASQTDFDFLRLLIDEGRIPADVTIQVLTQAREELIARTFEAIQGAPRAIVHLYNSTSELQRRVVFRTDREGIIALAVKGAKIVKRYADEARARGQEIVHQYSPESFTGTELDFAVDICKAVMDVWEPTPEKRVILNLPATVEMSSPNVHADQVEWFCRALPNRDCAIISVHPHNDRGCAVAAAELAVMAGAQRVEGTLFGNGERTGNVDLITLGMNLFTQGVDPGIDFSDMKRIVAMAEECNRIPVHVRHPWAGELVFTAFSGSHQDAINKGLKAMRETNQPLWEVPYLPIDPADIGRSYEAVIRVNSQSGKGGVAHILERDFDLKIPRGMQVEFAKVVQQLADKTGEEQTSDLIWRAFEQTYLYEGSGRFSFIDHRTVPVGEGVEANRAITARVMDGNVAKTVEGHGSGPIDALVDALRTNLDVDVTVQDYTEHALGSGSDAQAAAYVCVANHDGRTVWGAGLDRNIVAASLKAVLGAVNRLEQGEG